MTFGLLGLAVASSLSLYSQESPATNAASTRVVTAYLDYQEANYSFLSWGMPTVLRSSAFKKEPAFSGGKVVRGTWRLTGGTSNEVAFAWDRGARRLYVDLNRNLDLTDDRGGVYSSPGGGADYFQMFPNVRLPLSAGTGGRQMLVDVSLYDYGSQPTSIVALRSFWQGKVSLQGEEWQVGLLATPAEEQASFEGSSLLLRPWSQRSEPFSLQNGTLAGFPLSRKVFFGGQAYQLQYATETQGDYPRMRMQFTEQAPKLGELKITGQFVQRMVLQGGPYVVVLDQPAATVSVPLGRYKQAKVCLKKGGAEAYLDGRAQLAAGGVTVTDQRPAVLAAGGPLTNLVSVSRRGRNLALNYELVGAGGEYQMVSQDRAHPPEFTIYQADKKIASGKFEFG